MERLAGQRVYLSGAMQFTNDNGTRWRDRITPTLNELGLVVINPINKPIKELQEDDSLVTKRNELRDLNDWDSLTQIMKPIRHSDLRLVDISDFMIAVLDITNYACGTFEELFCANSQKKPVIVLFIQGKNCAPDWLFATIPHQMIFSDWDSLFSYLGHINEDTEIDYLGRWLFPVWE